MAITRTDKIPVELLLAEAMLAPGDHIERQEADGQRELVTTNRGLRKTLPTDGLDGCPWATDVEPVEGDPLFSTATLPEGWGVKPTDHSMWSDVIDDRGRVRGGIFYKAAFYDRRASIRVTCAVYVQTNYDAEEQGISCAEVFDRRSESDTVVHRVEEPLSDDPKQHWKQRERLWGSAYDWLSSMGIDPVDQALWDLEPLPEVES